MTAETHYAKNGPTSIAYQVVGNGDIDLVFVPCWVSHLDHLWEEPRFVRWIESLSAFGRVILFDKRGNGLSDAASAFVPSTLDQRRDDLRAVLDAAGSKRAVLVGVSLGSPLATLFASTYPERTAGLVMFGGTARRTWAPDYPWAPTPGQHERMLERLRREWGGPVDLNLFAPSLAGDTRFREWWAAYLRRSASLSSALTAERLDAEIDVRPLLPAINVPTLVLHRTGDRVVNVAEGRYLAGHIPGARFVELPGDDHIPFVGDQDTLCAEIGLFLTGRQPARPPSRELATAVAVDVLTDAPRSKDGRPVDDQHALPALVHHAMARHQGRRFATSRDRLVATFTGPAAALGFAATVLDGARRLGLHARAGLHTGEVVIAGDEIGGLASELAVRVVAEARAGEILVTRTVQDLAAGSGTWFEPVADRAGTRLPHDVQLARLVRGTATIGRGIAGAEVGARPDSARLSVLSRREREVAALVSRGLSNRQLAGELDISLATVERHVTNVLTKLGFRSRTQIAAWAAMQSTAATRPAPRPLERPALTLHRQPTSDSIAARIPA